MRGKWTSLLTCCLAILIVGSIRLPAQSSQPNPPLRRFGQWPQGGIGLLGFEAALGNRVVTGEPYSAQVTVKHTETLAGGTSIDRKNAFLVYRDSQGRTRRELTLPAIGSYKAAGEPPKVIFINDPVAGVRYVLDPQRKTARRFNLTQPTPPANPGRPSQQGSRTNPDVTTTSLGSKTLDGIYVQGTQITRTIPTDRIGNNKPIKIVSTRWYSPDLRINVETMLQDPLRGNTTLSLTNINRDEPDAALFTVPAGYTVQEGSFRGRRHGGLRGKP
jgi:hypothetical protein